MGDRDEIGRLIRQVTDSVENRPSFEKVYRDEPLLFTASQMKNYTPPIYAGMRALITGRDLLYKSGAEIFYLQGKYLENAEDDFPFRETFTRYFPTYRELSLPQLRGYISWRTKLRKGEVLPAPLPFRYLYVYELLNLIGVSSPEEGFSALTRFYGDGTDATLLRFLKPWLTDFAVYYGLDPACLPPSPEQKYDAALLTLSDYPQKSPGEVLDALCVFSSYNLQNSAFYKKHSEEVAAVVFRVFDLLSDRYRTRTDRGMLEHLFGTFERYRHTMFASAVFYEKTPHPDAVYEISPVFRFLCQNGEWRCERFFAQKDKAGKLGVLLKTVDCRMRVHYREKNLLKPVDCPRIFTEAVEKAILLFLKEKREKARPVIEIDRSVLPSIRATADITREKLIVEEEPEEILSAPEPLPAQDTGLTDAQLAVLRSLLTGGDPDAAAKSHGQMLSLVIDAVNEALFDRFADTVIEYDGDLPRVIEDYETELKGMLHL